MDAGLFYGGLRILYGCIGVFTSALHYSLPRPVVIDVFHRHNATLRQLELHRNHIGDVGAAAIGEGLRCVTLDFCWPFFLSGVRRPPENV